MCCERPDQIVNDGRVPYKQIDAVLDVDAECVFTAHGWTEIAGPPRVKICPVDCGGFCRTARYYIAKIDLRIKTHKCLPKKSLAIHPSHCAFKVPLDFVRVFFERAPDSVTVNCLDVKGWPVMQMERMPGAALIADHAPETVC